MLIMKTMSVSEGSFLESWYSARVVTKAIKKRSQQSACDLVIRWSPSFGVFADV